MQQSKKKVIDINQYLDKNIDRKKIYAEKYKTSLSRAKASETDANNIDKLNLKTGYYSMRTRIIKNPWTASRPASQAARWLATDVFKNPADFRYKKRLMEQGQLFMFQYFYPKYKGTTKLPWFDKYPLVLSLGPIVTKQGVRNIGFNLHLLPPKIRIVVICGIFELYKKLYRYQIFFKQEHPVQINYKHIIKALDRYGVRFCVRMYIPNRQNQIVHFPIRTWHKAIFIPSRAYDGIRAAKLIQEWRKFCRRNHYGTRENINWKSVI